MGASSAQKELSAKYDLSNMSTPLSSVSKKPEINRDLATP
jgi:hypothetical protein